MLQRPDVNEMLAATRAVAERVGAPTARYCFDGRFAVDIALGWTLLLSPDDAGRIRVDACLRRRVRGSMWARSDDHERLRLLACSAQSEAKSLVA